MKINRKLAAASALLLALGIAMGALGAHGLEKSISESYLHTFETGVKYQIYSALGLLILSLSGIEIKGANRLIVSGSCIFSFSLYLLSMNELWGNGLRKLGAVTPIGGVLMIAGWCWVAWTLLKRNNG